MTNCARVQTRNTVIIQIYLYISGSPKPRMAHGYTKRYQKNINADCTSSSNNDIHNVYLYMVQTHWAISHNASGPQKICLLEVELG